MKALVHKSPEEDKMKSTLGWKARTEESNSEKYGYRREESFSGKHLSTSHRMCYNNYVSHING